MRAVVITGVSTGIGHDAARTLVARGYHVFGSVRRAADGERIQAELGDGFTPLLLDVTDDAAVQNAAAMVADQVGDAGLVGLVNNAGIAVSGPAQHVALDAYRHQLEVNVIGLIGVTQAFLPLLGARHPCPHPPGRIINIGSISGRVGYPFLGPYVASKHAVEGFSDSLRRELMLYGVDVIVIEAGAVKTPIWDKEQEHDLARYAGTDYYPMVQHSAAMTAKIARTAMPVAKMTAIIVTALEAPRPKARYVLLKPDSRFGGWWLPRFAPTRWVDRVVARWLNLQPSALGGATGGASAENKAAPQMDTDGHG